MSAPENVRRNQRQRGILALTPLTFIVLVLVFTGDKTGPYHGEIRSALVVAGSLGLALAWFFMLWGTRTSSKG